jgi:ribosomal-protein-alanine N-acetyltransferase
MTPRIQIETPRLLLKSVTPSVIKECFVNFSEPEIKAFFGVGQDGYDHLKTMFEQGMETHRISLFYFLLHDRETLKIMGECGFHTWNKTHNRAELFYAMRNDTHKRKGFMTEAVPHVLKFGFNTLSLHRVEALIDYENTASRKILERFKFTREGTVRQDYVVNGKNEDSECFSLLKWEWANPQS